jgi:lipoyl(octanoyl) transferase
VDASADGPPRKLGALGLRVERGITFHGIAFNVTTRLADFGLIDPCGMAGLEVTSIARELGWSGREGEPSTESVREAAERFARAFGRRLEEASADARRSTDPGASGQTRDRSPAAHRSAA